MGQDQVSGGKSVLCWLAAPVEIFYGNPPNLGRIEQLAIFAYQLDSSDSEQHDKGVSLAIEI